MTIILRTREFDMATPFSLEGKVALVTGANTGLGQAIAVALAEAGADIAAAGRSAPTETQKAVEATGRRFLSIKADFGSIEPVQRVVDETLGAFGKVDILVNNAGIIRRADSIEFSEADWDAVMDTNLKVVFFLTQAVAKQMLKQGPGAQGVAGKVINIASLLSFQGGIRVPSYTASKSGLAGLTKILANEWATKGINVNAIAPGYFDTQQHRGPARRSGPQRRHPGPHPGRPLGPAVGHRRRGGVPGLERGRLRAGRHPAGRRWLAGALAPPTLVRRRLSRAMKAR
jgi:2-deoxy-D-gluconate 3-dehydrogenase